MTGIQRYYKTVLAMMYPDCCICDEFIQATEYGDILYYKCFNTLEDLIRAIDKELDK